MAPIQLTNAFGEVRSASSQSFGTGSLISALRDGSFVCEA